MSESVPLCTHIKTDGVRCGSPAVSGTALCYHHSAMKTTLDKAPARRGAVAGDFEPIPFVFAEDRAAVQLNYFLLLQAFNEGRMDLRAFKAMLGLLKAMAANLGETGSLVEDRDQGSGTRDQGSDRRSAVSDQVEGRDQGPGTRDQGRDQRSAIRKQETAGDVALSAAGERVGGGEFFPTGPDYGFLPSVASASMASADSFRAMARQAARMRW